MVGIVDTIKLAGTLVFAIPAALAGLEFLLMRGQPIVGGGLLVLATVLVLVQQFVPTPSSLPKLVAKRVVGSIAKPSETEKNDE